MIDHRLSSLSVCNKIFELNKREIVSIKDSIEEYYKINNKSLNSFLVAHN